MLALSTYLTERQVKVLKLLSKGLTVDEIARTLGVSRSDVYSLIRSAKRVVSKSANTIKLYNELMNNSTFTVSKGASINEVIVRILEKADERNIKLPLTTADLVLRIAKSIGGECVDLVNNVINCDFILYLDSIEGVTFSRTS
ncbi:MAG: Tfx family DNA-binding protein [Sulfolobales archaeon]